MTDPKHAPEPWRMSSERRNISNTIEAQSGRALYEGDDGFRTVASYQPRDGRDDVECMANGERIVACVNACQGITTAALDGGVVADLLAACEAALPAMRKALVFRQKLIGQVSGGIADVVAAMESAIAKARGATS